MRSPSELSGSATDLSVRSSRNTSSDLGGNRGLQPEPRYASNVRVELQSINLRIPRSCYEPTIGPGVPRASESAAVEQLLQTYAAQEQQEDQDYIEFLLMTMENTPWKMRSPSQLDTKLKHSDFFFDGVLSFADTRFYVQRVSIKFMPIGNYGNLKDRTVRHHLWIQSHMNVAPKTVTPSPVSLRRSTPASFIPSCGWLT